MASKKKQRKRPKARKGFSDLELSQIKKELESSRNRSILIEQDLRKLRARLNVEMPPTASPSNPAVFYKSFTFECGKCVKEFQHNTEIASIYHKVVCPKCNEEHILQFKPKVAQYDVKIPKSIKVVRR